MKNKKTLAILVPALIGLVIYLITSLTGYMVDTPFNAIPVVCTAVGMVLIIACDAVKPGIVKDVLLVAGALALIGASPCSSRFSFRSSTPFGGRWASRTPL